MKNDPLVHIVIPLYNEERVLARSVETLVQHLKDKFSYRYIITLANNASTDRSAIIAAELSKKYPEVRVLNLKKKGKGHAVKTAWSQGEGNILTFMDIDLASDLSFFPSLIDGVARKGYDMTVGNRLGKDSIITKRRFYRELMSRFYNFLVRLFLKSGLDDHQCGFKAMTVEAFKEIEPEWYEDGFSFDTEVIALFIKHKLSILPMDIIWNDSRESKISVFSDSFKMFKNILLFRKRIYGPFRNLIFFVCLVCTVIIAAVSVSIFRPETISQGDAVSYLRSMVALDTGTAASAGSLAYRFITTAGGLWTIIGLSKFFDSYENAWTFLNVFFYICTVIFGYELVRRIHKSERVALLSALFLAGNYAMVTFGLGYFMDVGGWMFYILAALGVLMYAQSGRQKNLLWAAVAVGIGGLFKEYAFLGAFLIGLYLIYENCQKPTDFLRKIWRPVLIVAVPTAILHGIIYLKYHFTYIDWLAYNQGHYVYTSRIVEYIKTLGSLLNLLGLLALIGVFYFGKKWFNSRKIFDAPENNTLVFVICLLLSMLPVLFWPAITQRIMFVVVPVMVIFASYLFMRFERRWYLFLPILAVYILTSFYMDSFILNFVNLPF